MSRSKDPLPTFRLMAACLLLPVVAAAPLPAEFSATDLEREEFLREASIGKVTMISVGVTRPLRATLTHQGLTHYAHIQQIDTSLKRFRTQKRTYADFKDCYRYNIAAYRLDRLLGLDMVPVSVQRSYRGNRAAFTWWVDDVLMSDADRYRQDIQPPDPDRWRKQKYRAEIFNQLIFNEDPNLGNFIIDEGWRLWLIDFTRAFRRHKKLQEPRAIQKVDRRLYEGLRALDPEDLERETVPHLTKPERRAVLSRRDRILEVLDSRIATSGEAVVIFDLPGQ